MDGNGFNEIIQGIVFDLKVNNIEDYKGLLKMSESLQGVLLNSVQDAKSFESAINKLNDRLAELIVKQKKAAETGDELSKKEQRQIKNIPLRIELMKQGSQQYNVFQQAAKKTQQVQEELSATQQKADKITKELNKSVQIQTGTIKELSKENENLITSLDKVVKEKQVLNKENEKLTKSAEKLNKVNKETSMTEEQKAKAFATSATRLSFLTVGMGLAYSSFAKNIIETASNFEQYKIKLQTVTGSSEEAVKQLSYLKKYAEQTPFNVEELTQAGTTLKIYGQDIQQTMPLVADLAATMGREIPHAALAFGRAMKGSTFGFRILRESYGITTEELKKFGAIVDKGKLILHSHSEGVKRAGEALTNLIQTKYGNAMALQADTAKTSMANLQDVITNLTAEVGESFLPVVKQATIQLKGFLQGIRSLQDGYKDILPMALSLTGSFVGFLTVLSASGYAVQGVMNLRAALVALGATGQLISTVAGPVGILITLLSSLAYQVSAELNDYYKKESENLLRENQQIYENIDAWRNYIKILKDGGSLLENIKSGKITPEDIEKIIKGGEAQKKLFAPTIGNITDLYKEQFPILGGSTREETVRNVLFGNERAGAFGKETLLNLDLLYKRRDELIKQLEEDKKSKIYNVNLDNQQLQIINKLIIAYDKLLKYYDQTSKSLDDAKGNQEKYNNEVSKFIENIQKKDYYTSPEGYSKKEMSYKQGGILLGEEKRNILPFENEAPIYSMNDIIGMDPKELEYKSKSVYLKNIQNRMKTLKDYLLGGQVEEGKTKEDMLGEFNALSEEYKKIGKSIEDMGKALGKDKLKDWSKDVSSYLQDLDGNIKTVKKSLSGEGKGDLIDSGLARDLKIIAKQSEETQKAITGIDILIKKTKDRIAEYNKTAGTDPKVRGMKEAAETKLTELQKRRIKWESDLGELQVQGDNKRELYNQKQIDREIKKAEVIEKNYQREQLMDEIISGDKVKSVEEYINISVKGSNIKLQAELKAIDQVLAKTNLAEDEKQKLLQKRMEVDSKIKDNAIKGIGEGIDKWTTAQKALIKDKYEQLKIDEQALAIAIKQKANAEEIAKLQNQVSSGRANLLAEAKDKYTSLITDLYSKTHTPEQSSMLQTEIQRLNFKEFIDRMKEEFKDNGDLISQLVDLEKKLYDITDDEFKRQRDKDTKTVSKYSEGVATSGLHEGYKRNKYGRYNIFDQQEVLATTENEYSKQWTMTNNLQEIAKTIKDVQKKWDSINVNTINATGGSIDINNPSSVNLSGEAGGNNITDPTVRALNSTKSAATSKFSGRSNVVNVNIKEINAGNKVFADKIKNAVGSSIAKTMDLFAGVESVDGIQR